MKAYSTDLRERVVLAAKQGMPQAEIAKVFAISLSTIKRYLKQWRETDTLEPKPIPGRPSRKLALLQQDLEQMLAEAPDATLEQHCQTWEQKQGIKVSISTMSRAIQQLVNDVRSGSWLTLVKRKIDGVGEGGKRDDTLHMTRTRWTVLTEK